MKVCSYQHEEIVHDENVCPLCLALEKIDELKDEISDLEDKVEVLSNQL